MDQFIKNRLFYGEDNYKRIQSSKIMVIGLGGVGGYAVECLARLGVNNLIIVDFDIIQESNINRQIISNLNNIGIKKTDAFSTRIFEINPDCKVTKYNLKIDKNTVDCIPKDVDFVIDAIDDSEAKCEIYSYCIRNNIDFISSMGMAKRKNPSKLLIKTLNKTAYDPLAKKMRILCRQKEIDTSKVKTVYSEELPIETEALSSVIFVPAEAGILCAHSCIETIINNTKLPGTV